MANAAIEFMEEEEEVTVLPVEGEDGEPIDEPLTYDEDAPNLVPLFFDNKAGREALKKLSMTITDNFERAWEATEEYRERMAKDWRIFAGELPEKDWPFQNCANVNVPIMIENISRLSFRLHGEIFDNWDTVFNVLPVGPGDEKIAEIMTMHDNWQLRNQITDFPRQMHRGTLGFLAVGDVTCHSFYDPERRVNRHEILLPDQFVIPFVYTTTQPDYSDVPFMVKILHMQRHELQAHRKDWFGVDNVLAKTKPAYDDEPEQSMSDTMSQVQGIEKPDDSDYAPYKLLWFEGWLTLPNQDRDRYCQAIVDHRTRTILKLTVHEQPDWRDQRRYERQMMERDSYLMALEQHRANVAAMMTAYDVAQQGLDTAQENLETGREEGAFGPLQTELVSEKLEMARPPEPEEPPEPPPPGWMMDPEAYDVDEVGVPVPKPVKRVPIYLFAHGVCFEPLAGSLGLSPGRIEADYNRGANTAFNQFLDAATLANVRAFLTSENVDLPQDTKVSPGAFIRCTGVAAGELQNSIMPLDTGHGNPQLMQAVELMARMGQSAIQAQDILSGAPGKSGETFRGQQGRLEAATKQLSVLAGKYVDFLKQITKNNATLNSIHLDEDQVVEVTNHLTKQAVPLQVSRRMWERNYMVEFRSDLRFASTATRIAEADALMQMGMSLPFLQGNYAFLYHAFKAMLDARGKSEFLALLGQPPEPPQMFGVPTSPPAPPPGMMPPGMGPPQGPGGPPPQGMPQQGPPRPPQGPPGGAGRVGPPAPPSPGGQRMGPPAPGPGNA